MLKTRFSLVATSILILTLACGFCGASAQDAEAAKSNSTEKNADKKEIDAYRVDFSVNELEDGKKINTRQYSMYVNGNDANEIKIGTRVPVESKQSEFQYLDVGTNVWCRIGERANGVPLSVRAEISNFAMPEQQAQSTRPVLRQLSIKASTVAQLGKSMVVGSVDDPNSKRQFQLEVTVNKLK
jgi:hypothetical protein